MEWEDAIEEIAARIKSLIAEHGPNSVAFFSPATLSPSTARPSRWRRL
ncbi:hypothetical protein ACFSTD_02320 [Novosphingobium colocasiae]